MTTIPKTQDFARPAIYVAAVMTCVALQTGFDPWQTARGGVWAVSMLAASILGENLSSMTPVKELAQSLATKLFVAYPTSPFVKGFVDFVKDNLKFSTRKETTEKICNGFLMGIIRLPFFATAYLAVPHLIGFNASQGSKAVINFLSTHAPDFVFRYLPRQAATA